MSLLCLRFRNVASQLKVLHKPHPDLDLENLKGVIEKYLPQRLTPVNTQFAEVQVSRQDREDPFTYWDLLGIDAILELEDVQGDFTRVAVSFQTKEHKAYSVLSQAQKPVYTAARKALKIYRYWVFFLEGKHFPTSSEWVDILYSEIDLPTNKVGCKLITL